MVIVYHNSQTKKNLRERESKTNLSHQCGQLQSQLLVEWEFAEHDLLTDLITFQKSFLVNFAGNVFPPEQSVFVNETNDAFVLELSHTLFSKGSFPTGNDVTYL